MTDYTDAEVRGRLRQWKTQLDKGYCLLDQLWAKRGLHDDIAAFCGRGSTTGRQRAFSRIAKHLASTGATLEGVRLDGKMPIAVWSILKARVSVAEAPKEHALAQDCITVNYIIVGDLPDIGPAKADGLWTVEVPDHALGRLMHRSAAVPASIVMAAHHAALRLRQADVMPGDHLRRDFQFLLPAGPGAFVCSMGGAPDVSLKRELGMHVRARTWLSDDMLRDDQTPLIDDGEPGARMGDGWLLPAPLRRIIMLGGNTATLVTWAPGLPETLAAPRGRA